MSENSPDNRKTTRTKKILERLKRPVRKVRDFFSQRYVWLSLTVGFLWMLSAPFILTLALGFLSNGIEQLSWIFQAIYFPLTLSSYLLSDIVPLEMWIVVYGFAFVLSMLFCFCVAYILHRVRRSTHEQDEIRILNE